MKVLLNVPEDKIWESLPQDCRISIAEKAIGAVLKGELYPSGTEQLELAIELAERAVSPDIISRITRLEKVVFEAFLPKESNK